MALKEHLKQEQHPRIEFQTQMKEAPGHRERERESESRSSEHE